MKRTVEKQRLNAADAADLYGVPNWSGGYFRVGAEGHLDVTLGGASYPLTEMIRELKDAGHALPLILRFPQILEDRLAKLNQAFATATEKFGFENHYQGVFPVKVNQRRVVLETLAEVGARYRTGVEAGSKAELALCLVQDLHPEALLCCNGFQGRGLRPAWRSGGGGSTKTW